MDASDVKAWFSSHVTYEGEVYTIDLEQAAAIADLHKNTIVVARAGSGKTRTIVAKIVYLVAKCGMRPEEIMAFVFNSNAVAEINARLAKMLVDGEPVMSEVKIARTFHAFSRRVVYDICGGREKCGKILAGEKEDFVLMVARRLLKDKELRDKIKYVVRGDAENKKRLSDKEVAHFAKMMSQFINRAQQKYLGGEARLKNEIEARSAQADTTEVERCFLEVGLKCYKLYHYYLLNEAVRRRLGRFQEYGTDFNLIVSWAGKLISVKRKEAVRELDGLKYILVDEYQDFSQLFLSVINAVRTVRPEAKLFVVGDDWQAINRFAGSDVEYFKNFQGYFGEDVQKYAISTNYRCDFEIVDTARKFMKRAMREKGDFRAFSKRAGEVMVVNPREMAAKLRMTDVDARVSVEDVMYEVICRRMIGMPPKKSTVQYVKTLTGVISENVTAKEILLLHRNNETNIEGATLEGLKQGVRKALEVTGRMSAEEFDAKVRVMTMHKSKGLEAEVVIILEADAGVIPKSHAETRLYTVFGETDAVAMDDQKRLFYVAMTRAKKRLYIIHKPAEDDGFVGYLGKKPRKWLKNGKKVRKRG